MKNKAIITIFIIITLFQTIIPIKTNAFVEKHEVISEPAKIENQKSVDQVSQTTGLDVITGILLEPTVEFFTVIIDSVMGILSSFMTHSDFEFVMVDKMEDTPELGDAAAKYTINDMSTYENALGNLNIEYPNFTYSPEEIFAGNIDLLDINFIDDSNEDRDWNKIRDIISSWYKVIRMITIVGLLSVLIYTGIKIMISSSTKDKAKYKEMLVNWFIAVLLAFSMHYIMAFILNIGEEIMNLLQGISGIVEVNAGGRIFKTNLIGLARFQLQQQHFSAKVGYLVIYTALVVYTFKFTFVYLKRVLRMAFLTVIAPIVALTYPIDKMDGKAKGFEMWLKEYVYNVLLQPLHYILYYILVSSSLTLAARNPIYAIVALMFISQGERLLKKIFGFDKARAGTVGGIAGAFATGAITSSVMKFAKDPLHPFHGGKENAKSKVDQSSNRGYNDSYELPNDIIEDTEFERLLDTDVRGNVSERNTNELSDGSRTLPVEDFFSRYREELSQYTNAELGGLSYDEDVRSIEEILEQIANYQRQLRNLKFSEGEEIQLNSKIEGLEGLLGNRVMANEIYFNDAGIPLQYNDGDTRSSSDLMNEIMRLNELANNAFLPSNERRSYARQAEKLLKKLKKRMVQNQYIQRQGGLQGLLEQERQRSMPPAGETADLVVSNYTAQNNTNQRDEQQSNDVWDKFKNAPVTKGLANVGKTIIKPAWDVEKSAGYNGKKFIGKIAKGVAGATIGVAAVSVQAGISITDGKYNAMEGIATAGAGIAGASKLSKGAGNIGKTYREGANSGEDGQSIKEYSQQWFNRDDVISNYNREFPGQGKEMRQRAVDNYISRGITDFKEQKQAMKFANVLKKERGMDQDEADRVAVATLQYKQSLARNSNYTILFDKEKREKYLDVKADTYTGAASKKSVRRLHEDLIQNVIDFDKANR